MHCQGPAVADNFSAALLSSNDTEDSRQLKESIADLKFYAYGVISTLIIVLGIIGNIINLIVLTRPNLKGVTFVYLSWLASSDLATLFVAVLSSLRLHGVQPKTYTAAFFYAHVEMPLVNALMASSVFLVVAVTIDRYWSVCLPTRYKDIHNKRQARFAITLSYVAAAIIYIPVAFQKFPTGVDNPVTNSTEYVACEWGQISTHPAFKLYLLIKEIVVRVGPVLIVVILNTCIIITFRKLQKKRKSLLGCSADGKKFAEEQRLVILLVAIVIMFLICMTPAAILTNIISDSKENNYGFQIFRAVANNMEMMNFASNFYVYCLCSTEIRRTFFQTFGCLVKKGATAADPSMIMSDNTKITTCAKV